MSIISIIRDNRLNFKKPAHSIPSSQRRHARVGLSLLVLIFIGTSAFAYILGPTAARERQEFSVTAIVIQPAPRVTSPAKSPTSTSASDAARLEKTILSDANLTQAVQIISSTEKQDSDFSSEINTESLEKLRGKLRVTTTEATATDKTATQPAGPVEISITYTGRGDARQACRFVDALAEQAAQQDTARRQSAARDAHENAKKLAEQARLELFKTRADYDTFLNQHFSSRLSSTAQTTTPGPLPPGTNLSQPTPGLHFPRSDWTETPQSPTLNNPRWTDLNNKLSRLMNRRTQLLEKMTPAHPAVQNLDLEIQNLERLISSVPRQLARPSRDSLPSITPMPPNPTDDLLAPGGEGRPNRILADEPLQTPPQIISPNSEKLSTPSDLTASPTTQPRRRPPTPSELHPRLAKIFRQKQKALDLAQQKYNRLADLERVAWQNLSNVQQTEVISAVCPQIPAIISSESASTLPTGHFFAALIVGLCGAVGIGMFSAGVSPPSSFASATEVRNYLKVPVVGTMPAADLPGTDADRLSRPSTNRLALAAAGLIFLIVAVAIIIVMFSK